MATEEAKADANLVEEVQTENAVKEESRLSDSKDVVEKKSGDDLSVGSIQENQTAADNLRSSATDLKIVIDEKSNENEPETASKATDAKTALDKKKSARKSKENAPATRTTRKAAKGASKATDAKTAVDKRKSTKKSNENVPETTKVPLSATDSKIVLEKGKSDENVLETIEQTEEAPPISEEVISAPETKINETEITEVQPMKEGKKKFVMGKRFEYEYKPKETAPSGAESEVEHAEKSTEAGHVQHESDVSSNESQKGDGKLKDEKIDDGVLEIPETRVSLELKEDKKKKIKKNKKKLHTVYARRQVAADITAVGDAESISQKSIFSKHSFKSVGSVREPEFILKSDDESSYESASIDEDEEAFDTLLLKSMFLKEFEDLPELSDVISTSSKDKSIELGLESEHVIDVLDEGRFVKPITSASLGTISVTASVSLSHAETVEEEQQGLVVGEGSDLEIDIDLKSIDIDIDQKPTEKEQEVDASTALLDMEKTLIVEDFEDLENARQIAKEAAALRAQTLDFLYELFDEVVHTAEDKDARAKMAASLDKKLLWNHLKSLSVRHEGILSINRLLNRKMIEHYKRNKNVRAITPLQHNIETNEKIKYDEYLIKLDCLLDKEAELTAHQGVVVTNADNEVADIESEMEQREIEFEEFVRKTLVRHQFNYLPKVIDREIAKMASKRAEISELRLKVLYRQDTLAKLHAKMNELENFSDSLTMSGFMHMQTEIQALGKKIEERNNELNRLRGGCNSNLHILTHMREKQELLAKDLHAKTDHLYLLRQKRQTARQQLFSQKLLRNKLRQEMIDVSQQGGLLDKPNLMFDFDKTSDKVEELHSHVGKLKTVLAELMHRIEILVKK